MEKIILTKDFDSSVNLILPDGREVLRMSTEYVLRDDNSNNQAVVPEGLYGYSSPPKIIIEGSPNYPDDDNATGYPLYFMNVNDSAEIYHSGAGYDLEHSGSSHSFMDDANTTTYEVVKIKLNWRDAADFAELRGGKLAEINGTAEII